ncbi:hypothetical protein D3C79_702620 [compost metagenome]
MQAGHAGFKRHAYHIQIVAIARNELTLGHAPHRLDLIADTRRIFEVQCLTGVFHPLDQLMQHLLIFAGQEQAHIIHLLLIFFLTHQPGNARSQTTADLILQTRARAVAIHAVLALAYRE